MAGTTAGASKRPRCPRGCGRFAHGEQSCGKAGQTPWVTPEQARERDYAATRLWRKNHPERTAELGKRWRDKLRYRVLVAYSQDPPDCACCGEFLIPFLVLDHSQGGGNTARKAEGHRGGTAQYARLLKDGFPEGYQVLCWNCNAARGLYGQCPHEELGVCIK